MERTALETDLKIEREWRGTLQKNLEQEKEKEYETLQEQHHLMRITCDEQERALAELGSHLISFRSQTQILQESAPTLTIVFWTSKLRVEDMKEVQQALKEAQWADDREVTHCKQCEKAFSVSRRKHHCRNCGDIYCNECSDQKMPLPSSARPVRVCDSCQTLLLRRYSAN
ncbi:hypothetical protein LSH36_127g09000 [Paralvinella palmiformis]|uniref:FYVE-type domain-containing protein n=1 Tax=Paralvinella palmiformis TaxID=53620 RepID=A0AAD9JX65_9ANNE|nr:hypothetical protein LSH36_127g09000 [Paralvinella palmiformis]